jgi:hypothetical protein
MVQGLYVEQDKPDSPGRPGDDYVSVECLSCGNTHVVNPRTGNVLGHSGD